MFSDWATTLILFSSEIISHILCLVKVQWGSSYETFISIAGTSTPKWRELVWWPQCHTFLPQRNGFAPGSLSNYLWWRITFWNLHSKCMWYFHKMLLFRNGLPEKWNESTKRYKTKILIFILIFNRHKIYVQLFWKLLSAFQFWMCLIVKGQQRVCWWGLVHRLWTKSHCEQPIYSWVEMYE